MDHVTAIRGYITTMRKSPDYHLIVVTGPAGWAKTTTVELALNEAKIKSFMLGAYSTPLNFYNFLFEHSKDVIVIDDCSGLLNDQISMAILKAATWPQRASKRIVRWGSTSSKAAAPEFEFSGKFIIVCNSFPASPDANAIRSRGFSRRIEISETEGKRLLQGAALDKKRFPSTKIARQVTDFLCERLNSRTVDQISYRTLGMGYQLAQVHPENWREFLTPLLPIEKVDAKELVRELSTRDLKVNEQVRIFEETTGLKRRSFFNYRKEIDV
jgi:hypothetical protein